jgi:hypothetical protein
MNPSRAARVLVMAGDIGVEARHGRLRAIDRRSDGLALGIDMSSRSTVVDPPGASVAPCRRRA